MGLVSAFVRAGVPLPQGYSAASCRRMGPGASGARAGRVAALVELCNVSAQCSLCLPPYEQTQWPADDQWVPLCYPCYSAFRPCRRVTLSDAHPDGDASSRIAEWTPLARAEFADRFVAYYRRRRADDAAERGRRYALAFIWRYTCHTARPVPACAPPPRTQPATWLSAPAFIDSGARTVQLHWQWQRRSRHNKHTDPGASPALFTNCL